MSEHAVSDIDFAIKKIDLDRRQEFEDRLNGYFNIMRNEDDEAIIPEDQELASRALACKPNLHIDIRQFINQNKEVVTNGKLLSALKINFKDES